MAEEEKKPDTAAEGAAPDGVAVPDEAALAKAKKKKMLLIVGGAVALVLVLGGAAAFFLMGGKKAEDEHGAADPAAAASAAALVIYDVPQMSVNLASDDADQHFLRAKLALELKVAEDIPAAEAMLARLQDDWQSFLRQMRVEDFRGSAAIERLKENLVLRARQVMAPLTINNVLIREVLVQ
jgi:flagellar protein FliL